MERIAPLRLAESWDNVGLMLAQEAIISTASVVVCYHPVMFRPLSALTLDNPLQASLLRLIGSGISLYTPHTALDSVDGGINDWLASAFDASSDLNTSYLKPQTDPRGGTGRILTLPEPGLPILDIVDRIKRHLHISGQIQLSVPYSGGERNIKTIAICAGSGGSVFGNVDADLYFTGEMAHHEVLAAKALGRYVILCGHTNTERGYLPNLKQSLLAAPAEDSALSGLEIQISEEDRHPLQGV
ncbi:hypothetical protein EW145_g6703 [Phellinidium pouzarii]|uniref:Uncharacterized protein n=1 Tax=Phellinidium pouzarii TaxID=167371 RepID=A0A4S4KVN9_9AGAM|nr:hypothetical protein EW145_g6703 [Phellinidium pouzarii]